MSRWARFLIVFSFGTSILSAALGAETKPPKPSPDTAGKGNYELFFDFKNHNKVIYRFTPDQGDFVAFASWDAGVQEMKFKPLGKTAQLRRVRIRGESESVISAPKNLDGGRQVQLLVVPEPETWLEVDLNHSVILVNSQGVATEVPYASLAEEANARWHLRSFAGTNSGELGARQDVTAWIQAGAKRWRIVFLLEGSRQHSFVDVVPLEGVETFDPSRLVVTTPKLGEIEFAYILENNGQEAKAYRLKQYGATGRKASDYARVAISELPQLEDEYFMRRALLSATQTALKALPPPPPKDVRAHLADLEKSLRARIIGQPEVIDQILDIETRTLLKGPRKKAEVVYWMGLTGNGKDTSAEAWVDSVYGYDDAYQEHLFPVPILDSRAGVWELLGSAVGYRGSGGLTKFVRWLVAHSGGRYRIEANGQSEKEFHIEENEGWKPGVSLDGSPMPEKAFVFLNDFHLWSKEAKDLFVAETVEKGFFQVSGTTQGVSQLRVPVTFIIASNDGIEELAPRELNGQRYGKPLDYEQLLENWDRIHGDKKALMDAISRSNGEVNNAEAGDKAKGISERMINRIPEESVLMLRPLSKADLARIIQIKVERLSKSLQSERPPGYPVGPIEIKVGPRLQELVRDFEYMAEKNGRPLDGKIGSLIETPIFRAYRAGKIPFTKGRTQISVEARVKPDKSYDMVIRVSQPDGDADGKPVKDKRIRVAIAATARLRDPEPISLEEARALLELPDRLQDEVFGIAPIAERVARAVTSAEISRVRSNDPEDNKAPAKKFMFLGLSSTGKTETAKAIARNVFKDEGAMLTMDFSRVRSVHDLQELFLGTTDARNNAIKSKFMKEYDRRRGKMVVVLDEIANAPLEVLKALYDLFREGIVRTFSDGKERAMSQVIFVMTGNAGEEWYKDVPRGIPMTQQMEAFHEIYENSIQDREFQRETLEKYFSEALLNRIGEENIFFFSPMTFRTVRELSQAKLGAAIRNLAPSRGKHGWNLKFASLADYVAVLDMMEREGFVLREQGASIARYAEEQIEERVKYELFRNFIEPGTDLTLHYLEESRADGATDHVLEARAGNRHVRILFPKRHVEPVTRTPEIDQILTAYHEAGHSIVQKALFSGKLTPTRISIKPGVGKIAGRWIHYAGVASHENTEGYRMGREAVIGNIAGLLGGEVAQTLVSQGGAHDSGKSNDIERATELARRAILKWGLSEAWGRDAAPPDMLLNDYVATLSEDRRKLLESEIQLFLRQGREIARLVLEANFESHLLPLGVKLAEEGELDEDALREFYAARSFNRPSARSAAAAQAEAAPAAEALGIVDEAVSALDGILGRLFGGVDPELKPGVPRPSKIADIDAIVEKARADQIAQAKPPKNPPIAEAAAVPATEAQAAADPAAVTPLPVPAEAASAADAGCKAPLRSRKKAG